MKELTSEATTRYAVERKTDQWLFEFPNGRGASVISHPYSYGGNNGLYELAVIRWRGGHWDFDYGTDITDDVLGWLAPEDVERTLLRIRAMPPV